MGNLGRDRRFERDLDGGVGHAALQRLELGIDLFDLFPDFADLLGDLKHIADGAAAIEDFEGGFLGLAEVAETGISIDELAGDIFGFDALAEYLAEFREFGECAVEALLGDAEGEASSGGGDVVLGGVGLEVENVAALAADDLGDGFDGFGGVVYFEVDRSGFDELGGGLAGVGRVLRLRLGGIEAVGRFAIGGAYGGGFFLADGSGDLGGAAAVGSAGAVGGAGAGGEDGGAEEGGAEQFGEGDRLGLSGVLHGRLPGGMPWVDFWGCVGVTSVGWQVFSGRLGRLHKW